MIDDDGHFGDLENRRGGARRQVQQPSRARGAHGLSTNSRCGIGFRSAHSRESHPPRPGASQGNPAGGPFAPRDTSDPAIHPHHGDYPAREDAGAAWRLLWPVALALSAVGLYGVLRYSMVQRTREIGIRMALGAPFLHVIRTLTGGVAVTVAVGVAAGLAGGLASARLIASLLFEVKPSDFASVASPLVCLLVACGLAAYLARSPRRSR